MKTYNHNSPISGLFRFKGRITAVAASGCALLLAGCGDREEVTAYETTTTETDAAYVPPTAPNTTTTGATTRTAATDRTTEARRAEGGDATMVLDEETLNVQKRQVQEGGVLITKDVETRQVNQPVELRREEVNIERLSPEEARQRQLAMDQEGERFGESEIFIPLTREEAVAQKEVQAREVVRAETTAQTEQKNVDATLRREVVDIQRTGEAEMANSQQQGQQLAQRIREDLRTNIGDLEIEEQHLNQIQISAEQSTVTLAGTLPNEDAIEEIEEHVRSIDGVENVQNRLTAAE